MANLSSAHGTLTITAPNKDIIEDFMKNILKPWEKGEDKNPYTPYFGEPDLIFDQTGKTIAATIDFSATGRWTWESSLRHIDNHLAFHCTKEDLERLMRVDGGVTLTWSFSDVEEGCQVLYESTIDTIFKDGAIEVAERGATDYDYTKENYEKLGFDLENWSYDGEDEGTDEEHLENPSTKNSAE